MCESHQLQQHTANVWQFMEKPQLQIRFWPFKFSKNDGSPKIFLKLNYRTKFPCKNNHNTDHWTNYIFNIAWFSYLFWYKECLPTIETSIISSLDITLAATRKKTCLIFLMSAEKGWETTNYYQHESNNRVCHCFSRDADIMMYQCATLHIRK